MRIMIRLLYNTDLINAEQRSQLPIRKKPYWLMIDVGQHLGYYRGRRVRKWLVRFRQAGGSYPYQEMTIAEADDYSAADGSKKNSQFRAGADRRSLLVRQD